MSTLSDRLVLVICVGLGALAASWIVDAVYVSPMRDANQRIATWGTELAELQRRQINLERSLRSAKALPEASRLAVTEGDVATASARFQEIVRGMVLQNGGMVTSSQSINTDLGGGSTRLSILVRARFSEIGLLNFLREAESTRPIITVDALQAFPMPIAGDPLPLDLTATLSEFHTNANAP